MPNIQNSNISRVSSVAAINEEKEKPVNNIILLHAALAQANKILDESLRFERFESYGNKKGVDDSYGKLKWDHTKGAMFSVIQVLGGVAQLAALGTGYSKEVAEAIGQSLQATSQICSQYNQGNINAVDQNLIDSVKRVRDQLDQTVRMLQDTMDRTRESANSATSKAAAAFEIRA
jgi:hypothetical protein